MAYSAVPVSAEEKARKHRIRQARYGRTAKGKASSRRYERKPHRREQDMWRHRSQRRYKQIMENKI